MPAEWPATVVDCECRLWNVVNPLLNPMLVSAIIPAFNREATVCKAVESVIAQTYSPIEIIVVDDGSTDGTVSALEKYKDKIKLIRQNNAGPSAARNAGIRAARGEVVAFLDSDDEWLPEKTARQLSLLSKVAKPGVSCCVCNAEMRYADGTSRTSFEIARLRPPLSEGLWLNPSDVLLSRFLFFNQVVAVPRAVLDCAGVFREDYRIMEDYDLALRLSLAGPFAFIAEPLVVWHGGEANSLSGSAREKDVILRTIQILSEIQMVSNGGLNNHFLLRARLRALRQRAFLSELSARPEVMPRIIGGFLYQFLNLYKKLGFRSSSFPRMQVSEC